MYIIYLKLNHICIFIVDSGFFNEGERVGGILRFFNEVIELFMETIYQTQIIVPIKDFIYTL